MSKKRIKIMIQGPNRRTYFRKGPIALHVSDKHETMTAKCINADPLEWLTVGEVYQIETVGSNYRVVGIGFAVNEQNFKEMFEVI